MFILFGTYRFRPRALAFRADYCLRCGEATTSFQLRTFNAFHVFFVPVVPLGFWERWVCQGCQENPHRRVRTGRTMKLVGAALLGVFALAFWATPMEPGQEAVSWLFRIGAPLGAALAVVSAVRSRPEPTLSAQLGEIDDANTTNCPVCEGTLFELPEWHCPNCGIKKVSVKEPQGSESRRLTRA